MGIYFGEEFTHLMSDGRYGKKYALAKNKSLLNRVVNRVVYCCQLQSRNSNDWCFVRGCMTANSVGGSNTSATISIQPTTARQADSQTQTAVSDSEPSARVGAITTTTTNPTANNAGADGASRGGMGWGEVIMDGNTWGHSNNNVFGSGTSVTQRPNDPRSTVLHPTTLIQQHHQFLLMIL
uniref:Uncharacterized protein n=1 Tax=Meloidogyne enterolobii TaxID=390850 RepID=A0A6V7WGG7_MELEN|nr:unnamed protein product [Meloidogyne enterolobii]